MVSSDLFPLHFYYSGYGHGDRGEEEAETNALEGGYACGVASDLTSKGHEDAIIDGDEDDQEADGDDGE